MDWTPPAAPSSSPRESCDSDSALPRHAPYADFVPISLKYAVLERERRYRVASLPQRVDSTAEIVDHYVIGTRLRLREVLYEDGTTVRKLSHKVRLTDGPAEIACTNLYLDDDEWEILQQLPTKVVRKRRHIVRRDGLAVAVDEHTDGTLLAEIDDGEESSTRTPEWLEIIEDVTDDERWTGARLAR